MCKTEMLPTQTAWLVYPLLSRKILSAKGKAKMMSTALVSDGEQYFAPTANDCPNSSRQVSVASNKH